MKKFKIKHLCPILDGLIAWIDEEESLEGDDYLYISRIEQASHLFETFSHPVIECGMMICKDNLEPYDDNKQFESKSPYGKFLRSETYAFPNSMVSIYTFTQAKTIKVIENKTNRRLVDKDIFENEKIEQLELILDSHDKGKEDQLIFALREL